MSRLLETLIDSILLEEAEARMENFDPDDILSREEVMKSFGITEADLKDIEVDIL